MRLKKLDILKFVGLFCIILAHVNPPSIIFQIRNFDVILMIFISVYLYFTNKKKSERYDKYLYKRLKRLLLPTYIFLIIFFVIMIFINPSVVNLKTVINSFLLHNGIGYVWVIRIYLIIALLLPIAEKLISKYSFKNVFLITSLLYIMYELLFYIGLFNLNIVFEDILAYIMPCFVIIVIAYWLKNNESNRKQLFMFSIINLLIFVLFGVIIYAITGEIQNTNFSKYPFRIYYLSYAFLMIGIMLFVTNNDRLIKLIYNRFIEFISKSSLWIYFWHILFIYIMRISYNNLNWVIKYIVVIVASCVVTYIQNKIIDKLEKKKVSKQFLNIFRG